MSNLEASPSLSQPTTVKLAAVSEATQQLSIFSTEPDLTPVAQTVATKTSKVEPEPSAQASEVLTVPLEVVRRLVDQHDRPTGDFLAQATPSENSSLEQVREWYRAARDMNLGTALLHHIEELGKHLQHMTNLGRDFSIGTVTQKRMTRDLTSLKEYAAFILSHAGESVLEDTRLCRGKHYELQQTGDVLTVFRLSGETKTPILYATGDVIRRTSVEPGDCRRLAAFVEQIQMNMTLAGKQQKLALMS